MVANPTASSRGPVKEFNRATSGGDYFSPWSDVAAGQTCCVAVNIRWVRGGTPFMGIFRAYAATTELLIGAPFDDTIGPATVVGADTTNWQ
jgi:hypothetical protein